MLAVFSFSHLTYIALIEFVDSSPMGLATFSDSVATCSGKSVLAKNARQSDRRGDLDGRCRLRGAIFATQGLPERVAMETEVRSWTDF